MFAKLARSTIAVHDVEASRRWYQQVLGCQSAHGGSNYERLTTNGVLPQMRNKAAQTKPAALATA